MVSNKPNLSRRMSKRLFKGMYDLGTATGFDGIPVHILSECSQCRMKMAVDWNEFSKEVGIFGPRIL